MPENEALVRRAWAAYDRGDEKVFGACLAPDWREYDADGDSTTLADVVPGMLAQRVAFPDKHTEVQQVIREGDLVGADRQAASKPRDQHPSDRQWPHRRDVSGDGHQRLLHTAFGTTVSPPNR